MALSTQGSVAAWEVTFHLDRDKSTIPRYDLAEPSPKRETLPGGAGFLEKTAEGSGGLETAVYSPPPYAAIAGAFRSVTGPRHDQED